LFTINTNFFENLEERFIDGKIKEELYEKFASKFNMEKEELWLCALIPLGFTNTHSFPSAF
jgi:hypothetical protein